MKKKQLQEFFSRECLDQDDTWLGYYDEAGNGVEQVPEVAKIIDDWTGGELETILHVRAKRDLAISEFTDVLGHYGNPFFDEEERLTVGRRAPKPEKQPYGVSAFGAEALVRDWLKYLGFDDAETTQFRRDQGVDVTTKDFDVQVKNWTTDFIPVSAIREIYGVAVANKKNPMFFSHSEYSWDSIEFAEKVSMPLFRFKPETAEIISCNRQAEAIISQQRNHEKDIKALEHFWDVAIETEKVTRGYIYRLYSTLKSSKLRKYVDASEKYSLSVDFDPPIFSHENSICMNLSPEECIQHILKNFEKLKETRTPTGIVLDTLLHDVEWGFFRI